MSERLTPEDEKRIREGDMDFGDTTSLLAEIDALRAEKPRMVASTRLSARLRELIEWLGQRDYTRCDHLVRPLSDATACIEQQQAALEACRPVVEARLKLGHLRSCRIAPCDCGYAEAVKTIEEK